MGCGTPWIWRGTPRIVHLLRKTTSHATSPPLRFGSVTGCRPYTAPCNLASAPLRLGHGLSPLHCAMQPRLRSASARSRAVAPTLRHATSPPLRFGSVTGCRPYTAPCNLASAPLRLGHGLSPLHCAMQPRLRSASARSRAVAL